MGMRPTFHLVHDSLKDVYDIAARERDSRTSTLTNPGTGVEEPEWVVFERRCLWFAVCVWRQTFGLPPVLLSDIERLEARATSRDQLVFFCSELVADPGLSTI
jgi:hypothetical protein